MTTSAFGVEEGIAKKAGPDYSTAHEKWTRKERHADRTANVGEAVTAGGSALIGGAALRDAAFKDHPHWKLHAEKYVPKGVTETKAGFRAMATVGTAGTVAYVANKKKKKAQKLVDRYAPPQKVEKNLPLTALCKRAMSDSKLSSRKKTQAKLAIGGATLGLAAVGSKGGSKILPHIKNIGRTDKGRAYVKHLDDAATNLTIGAGGVGGAGGFNFASIQNAEAQRGAPKPMGKPVAKSFSLGRNPEEKKRIRRRALHAGMRGQPSDRLKLISDLTQAQRAQNVDLTLPPRTDQLDVTKAFDPERTRRRQSKVTEGAAYAGSAGALAAIPVLRARTKKKNTALKAERHAIRLKAAGHAAAAHDYHDVAARQHKLHYSPGSPATPDAANADHLMRLGNHEKQMQHSEHLRAKAVKFAKPSKGKVLIPVAVGAAMGGATIHHNRNRAGKPYLSRYQSK